MPHAPPPVSLRSHPADNPTTVPLFPRAVPASSPAVMVAVTALASVLIGAAVLAGWFFALPSLNQLHPLIGMMTAPAAFSAVLVGAALWLRRPAARARWQCYLGQTLAALAILIAVLALGTTVFAWTFSLDGAVLDGAFAEAFPGQLPVATALGFLFIGAAIVLLDVEIRGVSPSELLSLAAGLVSMLAFIAYTYGFISFFDVPTRRPLAFHTVLVLLGLAVGVLHARPERGLMRLATSPRSAGVMLRRLMPASVLVPALTGWLILQGQRAGWYPALLGLAFFVLAIVGMFSMLVWLTAVRMDRLDRKRLRAEERIRSLNADLERRVRDRTSELEAVNRELEAFSYSVSHDLRGPLRAIDGFGQILVEDYGEVLGEAGAGYLQRVRAASQRMGMLIDDMIGLARVSRSTLTRERVDLTGLAESVVDDLRSRDPRPDVAVVVQPGVAAEADLALMRIVLDNLLGNAWKFTRGAASPRIEFGVAAEAPLTCFVRDNGAGFDMRHAARLFTPFERLHRQDEFTGTGIGLATVRRIIQRHGGEIWAEAEPGRGATISFTL